MFGLGSDAEIVESITIENTGSTNLYINSFHNDIIECKWSKGDDVRTALNRP